MYARLGAWQGSAEELERWIERARDHVKPSIREDAGLKAAYWLADRAGGKALIVTFWESEEAMRASEEARQRRQGRHVGGHRRPGDDRAVRDRRRRLVI